MSALEVGVKLFSPICGSGLWNMECDGEKAATPGSDKGTLTCGADRGIIIT